MSKGSVKVNGGKLVNVEVEKESSKVKLTGDFFLQPPESREQIEETIQNNISAFDRENLVHKLSSLDVKFIGFSPKDVVKALEDALEGEDK